MDKANVAANADINADTNAVMLVGISSQPLQYRPYQRRVVITLNFDTAAFHNGDKHHYAALLAQAVRDTIIAELEEHLE